MLVRAALAGIGLEIRRRHRDDRPARGSLDGVLGHLAGLGWEPRTCIDVGAAFGDFTLACARVFPRSQYLMVEPLEEYRPYLDAVRSRLPHAALAPIAAAAQAGEANFNVHVDLVGSSLMCETEGGGVDGVSRTVPTSTLDRLSHEHGSTGPYLVKMDVQGAELDVLRGAGTVLAQTECVILELSLFRFFVNGPELPAVVNFMESRGFMPYDIFELRYRPLDGALSQLDMSFVRATGPFRRQHAYATREQRARQNAAFAAAVERRWRQLSDRRTAP